MRKAILTEFRIMFNRMSFWISMLSGVVFSIVVVIYNVFKSWGIQGSDIASPYAQYVLCDANSYSSIITIVFPFFVILPFALCHSIDKNKDTHIFYVSSRCTRRDYFISQAITVFIGTFIVMAVSLILNIILNYIIFPDNGLIPDWGATYSDNLLDSVTGSNSIVEYWHKGVYLKELFFNNSFLHNILFAFNAALFGGILALFAYSCSLYIESKSIFVFMPAFILIQVLNMLSSVVYTHPELIGHVRLFMVSYITTGVFTNGRDYRIYYFFLLILIIISCLIISNKIKKEELK